MKEPREVKSEAVGTKEPSIKSKNAGGKEEDGNEEENQRFKGHRNPKKLGQKEGRPNKEEEEEEERDLGYGYGWV